MTHYLITISVILIGFGALAWEAHRFCEAVDEERRAEARWIETLADDDTRGYSDRQIAELRLIEGGKE